jgi:hypothetical protein
MELTSLAVRRPGAPLAPGRRAKGVLKDHALWAISAREGQTKGW